MGEEEKDKAITPTEVEIVDDAGSTEGKRDAKGRWLPGYCPNPYGRPHVPENFKLTLRNNAMVALETIITIMNDPKARPADRIRASEVILERCYGKAVQPFAGDEEAPLVIRLAGALDNWSK
jgi:hypothetical protein